jgi:hypothetical protein
MSSLPIISSLEQLLPTLKIWQQTLNPLTNTPVPPRPPFNLRATGGASGATGITLNWELVTGADGYEIQSSSTGDFSNASIIATLTNIASTSWFDSTTVTSVKKYYRIRATIGTTNAPHSIKGAWSASISNTSGSGTTTYDQTSGNTGTGGFTGGRDSGIGPRRINTF